MGWINSWEIVLSSGKYTSCHPFSYNKNYHRHYGITFQIDALLWSTIGCVSLKHFSKPQTWNWTQQANSHGSLTNAYYTHGSTYHEDPILPIFPWMPTSLTSLRTSSHSAGCYCMSTIETNKTLIYTSLISENCPVLTLSSAVAIFWCFRDGRYIEFYYYYFNKGGKILLTCRGWVCITFDYKIQL